MIYDSILGTIGNTPVVRLQRLAPAHVELFVKAEFFNPMASVKDRLAIAIIEDAERRLDFFVTGWGTGGTMTGAGEMLKLARPELKVIACEPANASLMAGKEWTPHKIQGWTPDFLPRVLKVEVADEIIPITDEESRDTALALAAREGILAGLSGRRNRGRRPQGGPKRRARIGAAGHVAGYRRALPVHIPVRARQRGLRR